MQRSLRRPGDRGRSSEKCLPLDRRTRLFQAASDLRVGNRVRFPKRPSPTAPVGCRIFRHNTPRNTAQRIRFAGGSCETIRDVDVRFYATDTAAVAPFGAIGRFRSRFPRLKPGAIRPGPCRDHSRKRSERPNHAPVHRLRFRPGNCRPAGGGICESPVQGHVGKRSEGSSRRDVGK